MWGPPCLRPLGPSHMRLLVKFLEHDKHLPVSGLPLNGMFPLPAFPIISWLFSERPSCLKGPHTHPSPFSTQKPPSFFLSAYHNL